MMKWRIPSQRTWLQRLKGRLTNLSEIGLLSDIYKALFSEPCPQCHVSIVHLGGCKYMQCGRCNYEFCWLCLNEFYTEFHYYDSLCPARVVYMYSLCFLCLLFLLTKVFYSCSFFSSVLAQATSNSYLIDAVANFI